MKFIQKVILHDVSMRMADIENTRRVQHIEQLVLAFDYTTFPVEMLIGSVASLRGSHYNDRPNEREAWDEAVRRMTRCLHPENMVIVRARIPKGLCAMSLLMTGNINTIHADSGVLSDELLSMWMQV
jgi:hypothetical protein